MGIRELLILILGLAVVGVILRGLYVAINARRGQIKLAIDKNIPQDVDLDDLEMAELPGGGARVVKRSLETVNRQNAVQDELDLGDATSDEAVPMLMDTVQIRDKALPQQESSDQENPQSTDNSLSGHDQEQHIDSNNEDTHATQTEVPGQDLEGSSVDAVMTEQASGELNFDDTPEQQSEPTLGNLSDIDDEMDEFSMTAGERIGEPQDRKTKNPFVRNENQEAGGERKETLFTRFGRRSRHAGEGSRQREIPGHQQQDSREVPIPEKIDEPKTADSPARVDAQGNSEQVAEFKQTRESKKPESVDSKPSKRAVESSEVLVINVMSREGELFYGDELLQVLLTAGLKYGDMDIFHKHAGDNKNGSIIFSVANILNPGTFDLDGMDKFTTRGVSLFLSMPSAIGNRESI